MSHSYCLSCYYPPTHYLFNSTSPAHRSLPSFPTRRSSDLITPASTSDDIGKINYRRLDPLVGPVYIEGAKPGDALKIDVLRSEEHTSELQSPMYLVCRLLLEKKKKKNTKKENYANENTEWT